jgi:hypothetical protein
VLSLALAALAPLLLAACGGTSAANGTSTNNIADSALKFSKCMREHGIKDFPNPETSGGKTSLRFAVRPNSAGKPSPQALEAAQNACKHFQAAFAPKLTPQEKVERQEAVLRFAKCMREHGVDIHASTGGDAGFRIKVNPGGGAGGGPNPESPAFQSAQKACQGLLPFKGGPGKGPSTSTGGGGAGQTGPGLAVGGG